MVDVWASKLNEEEEDVIIYRTVGGNKSLRDVLEEFMYKTDHKVIEDRKGKSIEIYEDQVKIYYIFEDKMFYVLK